MSSGAAAAKVCPLPPIPSWAKIVNYRTMTNEKKDLVVAGNKNVQYEWMSLFFRVVRYSIIPSRSGVRRNWSRNRR